ncbi:hypothetical protein [Mycoplasma nasistruthionis]|uniref:Endonuclease/exonuclease/phosphatase domain-containing protein n=1 Tax=Mycoplasma nasistruthionis TaxID=353852 RepID=A0A4Y6I696_9MOLU|nr:hypothetical protein [Mycoplasma nasistruthionis]QDF64881.1 hypothetical protein FIV53_00945 [Mycoplasma nasistruthionis]
MKKSIWKLLILPLSTLPLAASCNQTQTKNVLQDDQPKNNSNTQNTPKSEEGLKNPNQSPDPNPNNSSPNVSELEKNKQNPEATPNEEITPSDKTTKEPTASTETENSNQNPSAETVGNNQTVSEENGNNQSSDLTSNEQPGETHGNPNDTNTPPETTPNPGVSGNEERNNEITEESDTDTEELTTLFSFKTESSEEQFNNYLESLELTEGAENDEITVRFSVNSKGDLTLAKRNANIENKVIFNTTEVPGQQIFENEEASKKTNARNRYVVGVYNKKRKDFKFKYFDKRKGKLFREKFSFRKHLAKSKDAEMTSNIPTPQPNNEVVRTENLSNSELKTVYVRPPFGVQFEIKNLDKLPSITTIFGHLDSPGSKGTKRYQESPISSKENLHSGVKESLGSQELAEFLAIPTLINNFKDQSDEDSVVIFGGDTNIKAKNFGLQNSFPTDIKPVISDLGTSDAYKTSLGRNNNYSEPYDKIFFKASPSEVLEYRTQLTDPVLAFKNDILKAFANHTLSEQDKQLEYYKSDANNPEFYNIRNRLSDHAPVFIDIRVNDEQYHSINNSESLIKDEKALRIAHWNVLNYGGDNFDVANAFKYVAIAKIIQSSGFDIIGLTEINYGASNDVASLLRELNKKRRIKLTNGSTKCHWCHLFKWSWI